MMGHTKNKDVLFNGEIVDKIQGQNMTHKKEYEDD